MVPILVGADRAAISGITGSISIACWIIVFTPQLYENFRRQSAEGLSLTFIVLWLLGDIFNVIGAVLQHVLPTMTILAVYYTLADIVLLIQCLVYNRRNVRAVEAQHNRVDASHLNPATPLLYDALEIETESTYSSILINGEDGSMGPSSSSHASTSASASAQAERRRKSNKSTKKKKPSAYADYLYNTVIVMLVVLSGVIGWAFTKDNNSGDGKPDNELEFNVMGQVFGWLCAVLYLGSRVPQIMLNFERKSCDGISFLFFLFACLGNLTYVISILANSLSKRYLLINASWLVGSMGTLGLDFLIFIQFWIYGSRQDDDDDTSDSESSCDSASG